MSDASIIPISQARIPQTYANAKSALSSCVTIDECKGWADKAAALASYAKQAGDDTLMNMAARIKGRAIRRAGELLEQIKPATGAHLKSDGAGTLSRKAVAEQAGMSKRQQVTAIRVANVPAEKFEAAIESEKPPTVTKLAEMGTAPRYEPMADTIARMVAGRTADQYERCLALCANTGSYFGEITKIDLDLTLPFLTDSERTTLREQIAAIDALHDKLITRI